MYGPPHATGVARRAGRKILGHLGSPSMTAAYNAFTAAKQTFDGSLSDTGPVSATRGKTRGGPAEVLKNPSAREAFLLRWLLPGSQAFH